MKIFTQNSKRTSINLSCFLGTILMIALMLPAAVVAQTSPLPVDLGTSGDFVVLAKTGISTTGTTRIVGDIGASPNSATSITGFGLIADASGEFATSSLVTGKVYAADFAAPTPTKMTTAVSDMETAFGDAAGRAPDYTELYAGDLTGQTLTTGVYKWGTGVLVSAGGVTISGNSTDVFIFQIAQNLTIANGASINLIGGAQASNIFWQVAGNATLGTTSDFSGVILCQTLIDMQTGAAFDGRALSQTAVTIDANSINSCATRSTDTEVACNSYDWIDGNTYISSNTAATHILTNSAGCDSIVSLDLTINNVSELTTTTSGATITANNTNTTYAWLDCDNNYAVITGETNQSYIASSNGNYAVELTENGCVDTSDCAAITTVGIIENHFGNELTVYPNPTDGNFSIDLGMNYESATVRVTDINGKLIQSNSYNGSQFLDLKLEEPAGVYLLVIESEEKNAVIRVLKK